jgi:hypothetical protein
MTDKHDETHIRHDEQKGRPARPNENTGDRHTKVDVSEKGKKEDQKAADKQKSSLT